MGLLYGENCMITFIVFSLDFSIAFFLIYILFL